MWLPVMTVGLIGYMVKNPYIHKCPFKPSTPETIGCNVKTSVVLFVNGGEVSGLGYARLKDLMSRGTANSGNT